MTFLTPSWMNEELQIFSDQVGRFLDNEAVPHNDKWVHQGHVDRDFWNKAGDAGLLCAMIPSEYGGAGGDFSHEAVIIHQTSRKNVAGWGNSVHSGIVAPYILHYGTDDQKKKWLPKLASGEWVGAIAMTEPGTGSDLQAVRTTAKLNGNEYVVNGQKTFITNGQQADLICVVARTGDDGAKGISLIMVEADREGFRRGRNLEKIGHKAQDTSELFFDDVRVPTANLLGVEEGQGFYQLMQQLPQERLVIALQAVAAMEAAIETTVEYVKERKAFGQRVMDFQNSQFKLAECRTKAQVARMYVDACVEKHLRGELDATEGAMAKLWTTDTQCEIVDECLQLHGGYGYMAEYPIARMYTDARVQRIYGGTNEIMKLLVARSL